MRLVYEKTGEEVKVGDAVTAFHGRNVKVLQFKHRHPGSNGKVTVTEDKWMQEYYVSVIGAKWVKE